MAEAAPCDYCNHPIVETEPTSVLLCLHRVHTTCFLKANCADSPRFLQCPTCHGPLTPPDFLQTFIQADTPTADFADDVPIAETGPHVNVLEMYNTQEEFKKAVKAYHKQLVKASSTQSKLRKAIRERRQLFRQHVEVVREAIAEESRTQQELLKQSDIMKDALKETRKLKKLASDIRTTYHVGPYHLKTKLADQPGLRRWPHCYRHPTTLVKYAFILRIR